MAVIPYSAQTVDKNDIKAVAKILSSPWLTTGPVVEQFEKAIAKFVGAKYAVAVSSGTGALHLACLSLDLKPNDEVITTPYSFAATSNCILYAGAIPVFVDINQESLCIDTDRIKKAITPKTRAIIAVDFAGLPADWTKLRKLARKYGLKLIADAAHSFGAKYKGKPIGTQADITCFSFHPVKTITAGEGGMIVTNNKSYYRKAKMLRTHGIVKKNDSQPWFYEMKKLGFNYRLTDIQCALGLSQLKRARAYVRKRALLAKRYDRAFKDSQQITLPPSIEDRKSSWHLYPTRINFKKIGKTKIQFFQLMEKHGVNLQVHYIPIHLHPYYQKRFGYKQNDFPVSVRAYSQEVSLPLYPGLTLSQQDKVIGLVRKFCR